MRRWCFILGLLPSVLLVAKTMDPVSVSYLNYMQDLYSEKGHFVRGDTKRARIQNTKSVADASMFVKNPHFQRTMRLKIWSEGKKKTLVLIQKPVRDRGTVTLKLDKELWNYLPRTSRVIKVPDSLMSQGWMGSDYTNNDIVREVRYTEAYTCSRKDGKVVVLSCVPDPGQPIVWGKVVFYVSAKTAIPRHADYYDQTKKKMVRTIVFLKPKTFSGRVLPSVLEVIPKDKKGHLTRLMYHKINFNTKIPSNFFSVDNMQNVGGSL